MRIAEFKLKDCLLLLAELKSATKFSPTGDDIWKPALYKGGKVVDSEGREEGHPDFDWPDYKQIDPAKLKPMLIMVKDQGLYLITNADLKGTPSQRGTVVYAEGCHPDKDEDWYESARALFGGDDGTVGLSPDWCKPALKAGAEFVRIKITNTTIELLK